MGFLDRTKSIGGKERPRPQPPPAPEPEKKTENPETDSYEPDPEELSPPLPDPLEEPEKKYRPNSTNPFGNPFEKNEDDGRREVILPNERIDGINENDRKKAEIFEKEFEDRKKNLEILTDEVKDGEKVIGSPEIKNSFGEEEIRRQAEIIIGNTSFIVEDCTGMKAKDNDDKSCDRKEGREPYSLDAMSTVPKITFAKPKEAGGGLKKLLFFLCACVAVGTFLGVKANSYWVSTGMKSGGFESAYMWLLKENLPTVLNPLSPQIFGAGFCFGAGLLGIIGLFVYLDNDQKKRSRVGHEHGYTHIAEKKDFNVYKNKFMED